MRSHFSLPFDWWTSLAAITEIWKQPLCWCWKKKTCNKGMDSQRFFKWLLLFISLFKLTNSVLSLLLRVTRKLTSNAVYFRDLTKKWYLLFSWGKTSKYHHSYNRVLYLTSQQPLQGTNFVGTIGKERQPRKNGGGGVWRRESGGRSHSFPCHFFPDPHHPLWEWLWTLLISVSQMLSGIYSKNIYLSFREMYNIPLFTVSYIFFHSECVENQVLLTAWIINHFVAVMHESIVVFGWIWKASQYELIKLLGMKKNLFTCATSLLIQVLISYVCALYII